jgi:pimeloyl-ACP methyl ester carboxylesterase
MANVDSIEVQAGNSTVRVQRAGEGPCKVLYLHGAGGVAEWSPFFDSIADGRQLLVPDHPGFGASAEVDELRDVPDYAMFYLDFLDAMDLTDVHVIGHSLGGWIAAEMAIRNETRVRSWSLLAPAGIRLIGQPMADVFICSPEEGMRSLFHDQNFAEQMLAQEPSPEQVEIALRNRFTFAKLAWQPRGFNPALAKWLHRIKKPTTIVWGQQDQLLGVDYADLWSQHIPHAKIHRLDDCGHLPDVEQTGTTAQILIKQIAEDGGVQR